MFRALLGEYRVTLNREAGCNPGRPDVARRHMIAFADAVPADRRRPEGRAVPRRRQPCNMNAVHGIDAVSMAVPYCHVVSSSRTETASLLSRSRAAQRHGTQIITALPDLRAALPSLRQNNSSRHETGVLSGTGCPPRDPEQIPLPRTSQIYGGWSRHSEVAWV